MPQSAGRRREEGRRIDVEPHDEEAQAVQAEGAGGQDQQLSVIANEDAGHIRDDEHGADGQENGHHADEPEAHGVEVVDLFPVAGTVVVADDGRRHSRRTPPRTGRTHT